MNIKEMPYRKIDNNIFNQIIMTETVYILSGTIRITNIRDEQRNG